MMATYVYMSMDMATNTGATAGCIYSGGDGGYDECMGYSDHECHDDYWHSCCY